MPPRGLNFGVAGCTGVARSVTRAAIPFRVPTNEGKYETRENARKYQNLLKAASPHLHVKGTFGTAVRHIVPGHTIANPTGTDPMPITLAVCNALAVVFGVVPPC